MSLSQSVTNALIAGLNQQVQQTPQPTASSVPPANTGTSSNSATTATAGPLTPIALSSPAVFTKPDFSYDANWHTLQVPQIPTTAKWIYANVNYLNQGSFNGGTDNVRQTLTVQSAQGQPEIVISQSNGVSGNYENDGAYPVWIPVSSASFMYNWSDPISFFTFTVLFYS
jgi:hypothetical protein